MDLPLIWAILIAVAILMYVVLDGFDLGIGILFPFAKSHSDRDVMMNSVAPVWDGNETWLILGGGGLFVAFPLAYAVLMPAFYAPVLAMLIALIFRGVAFEFRWRTDRRDKWDLAFFAGSLMAAFCQGIMLGAFIQGVPVEGRAYAGGWFVWLSPFSLSTGIAVVIGYALLGATWTILKTENALKAWAIGRARPLSIALLVAIAVVSVWTPLLHDDIAQRWFAFPNILLVAPVPLLVAVAALFLWRGLDRDKDLQPFLCAQALFVLSFAGLGVSLFPYAVPRVFTIWQAAAPDSSLIFMLVGTAVLLPMVLGYTIYAYWVFRGKIDPEAGYH